MAISTQELGDAAADLLRRRVGVLTPKPTAEHVDPDVVHPEHGVQAIGDPLARLIWTQWWSHEKPLARTLLILSDRQREMPKAIARLGLQPAFYDALRRADKL